jgi:hypothetical protein
MLSIIIRFYLCFEGTKRVWVGDEAQTTRERAQTTQNASFGLLVRFFLLFGVFLVVTNII